MLLIALICATAFVQESDEDTRARIRAKVDRLAGEDIEDRDRAAAELLKIHVRYAPYIADLGTRLGPGAAALLERLAVPAPWPEFLKGTIHEARALVARISAGEGGRNSAAAADALKELALRPSLDIQRILSAFWSSSNARFRELAVDGWLRWPPVDLAPLRPLLADPVYEKPVADILILAGDEDCVPDAVAAYVARRRESSHPAKVLSRFGVPDSDLDRVMGVWKDGLAPDTEDFWILGRRGTEEGTRRLAEWIKSSSPGFGKAVPVLAWMGQESHMMVVRSWAADHVKDKYVPWPLFDPAAAVRRFESLGTDPARQELFNLPEWAWEAGPALRQPILERLKRPELKLNARRQFLRMLGWAGRSEDGALLVESLADPRLADAAAEALDMMGDPAHAKALFAAYMRIAESKYLGQAVMSMPPDGLEDLLVEVIEDADSYPRQATPAVLLAGRNLTPRLRDVLIKAYEEFTSAIGTPIEAVFLDPIRVTDVPLVARLKVHKNPVLRAIGHHLAMRAGDADSLPAAVEGSRGRRRFWLDLGLAAGDAWPEALSADWKKVMNQPGPPWTTAHWLAERGDPEALPYLRGKLAERPTMETPAQARALALGGTPEDVIKAVEMFLDPRLQLELYGEGAVPLDPRIGARLDPAHKSRILDRARQEAPHRSSGNPYRRAVVAAAQLGLTEARPLLRHVAGHTQVAAMPPYSSEQTECIKSLMLQKDVRSLPLFRQQVRSRIPAVRAAAIDALAALGDRKDAARIARYVDDPSEVNPKSDRYEYGAYTVHPVRRVWHHAMEALEKLTGEKPPPGSVTQRREFWRAWAAKNP